MPSPSTRPARRAARIDGLRIRIIDDSTLNGAEIDRALRTLTRMMVRAHGHAGDHEAIVGALRSPLPLTRVAFPRTDHTDEAA